MYWAINGANVGRVAMMGSISLKMAYIEPAVAAPTMIKMRKKATHQEMW